MEPVELARAFVTDRFPAAEAAFLAGSTASGTDTATSDLDIVVVQGDHRAETYRETLRYHSKLVELFAQTPSTLTDIWDADRDSGRGTSLAMYAFGIVLASRDIRAENLQAQALELYVSGPPAVAPDTLESWRYALTDALDDLTDLTDPHEIAACATTVLTGAADLACARAGRWTGRGKWLPRRLKEADPDHSATLLDGFSHATGPAADPGPLITAAYAVLTTCGGPIREGYRRTWTRPLR